MSLLNPISRKEQYLNIIAGGSGSVPDYPISRIEQYLAAIAGREANYPQSETPEWNTETVAGEVTPDITLPALIEGYAAEYRYIFTAKTDSASFKAPAGVILRTDDAATAAGGTLTLTDLTVGSIYECSFAVLDDGLIGLLMHEWKEVV